MNWSTPQSLDRGQCLYLKPLGWLWTEQRLKGLSQPTVPSSHSRCPARALAALHVTCRWLWPDFVLLPCSLLISVFRFIFIPEGHCAGTHRKELWGHHCTRNNLCQVLCSMVSGYLRHCASACCLTVHFSAVQPSCREWCRCTVSSKSFIYFKAQST